MSRAGEAGDRGSPADQALRRDGRRRSAQLRCPARRGDRVPGPNGSGKSTTMRLILGLDSADAGQARVGGRPYRDLRWPLREVGALLEARAFHLAGRRRQRRVRRAAPPVMWVGYGLLTYIGCLPANQPSRRLRMRSESQPPSSTAARYTGPRTRRQLRWARTWPGLRPRGGSQVPLSRRTGPRVPRGQSRRCPLARVRRRRRSWRVRCRLRGRSQQRRPARSCRCAGTWALDLTG